MKENAEQVTRFQRRFLKRLRLNPKLRAGDWPSPVILERWLKHPGFCRALSRTQEACRFQSDFAITTASAHAAWALRETLRQPEPVVDSSPELQLQNRHQLLQVLRMAYRRT